MARSRIPTRWLVAGGTTLVALVVFVLVWFQPQKLFIDDTVDETVPAGAAPVVVVPPTEPMTDGTEPMTDGTEPMTDGTEPMTDGTAAPATTTPPQPVATAFVSLDHGTSGSLLVLRAEDGAVFVRFEDLDTDNGPDLKVYLSTNPIDGPEQAFDDDFVDLGRLKGNKGSQNYEVPAGTDLSRYRSVVIWCDRFNSAFGAAPLAP